MGVYVTDRGFKINLIQLTGKYVALCTVQRRQKIDAVDRLRSKIYSPKIDRKQVYLWISLWVQLTLMDWPFGIIRKIFTSLHTATSMIKF